MIFQGAEQRLKVLQFWESHDLTATHEAFGVSRRTLFAWRAKLRNARAKPTGLAPRSTRPKHVRQRRWPAAVIQQIRRLRAAHPNLDKEELHPFVQRFCQIQGVAVRLGTACDSTHAVRSVGSWLRDVASCLRTTQLRLSET